MRLVLMVPAAAFFVFLYSCVFAFDSDYAVQELGKLQGDADVYAVKKHIERAAVLCQKGSYTRAKEELGILKKIDPENSSVYEDIIRGSGGVRQREVPAGEKETAENIKPDYTALKEAEYIRERFERALRHYENSRLSECGLVLEEIFLVDKKNKSAAELLEIMDEEKFIMESDRPFQKIVKELFDKGMVFFRRGKHTDAERMFIQARDTDPANRQVKEYLMKATAELAARKEAEETEKMLERADMLRSSGNIKDSRKLYLKVREKDPENLKAGFYISDYSKKSRELINRAAALDEEGKTDIAYNNAVLACDYDPDNRRAGTVKNRLKVKLAKKKKAAVRRRKANRYYNKGVEYFAKQEYEKARQAWEQVLELTPNDKEAAANIVRAREKLEADSQKRRKKIDETLERGRRFLEQGLIAQAKNEYEVVRRMEPGNEEAAEKIEYINSLENEVSNEALDKR
ncbi:MAG: tetratricopeptide repeat protein [bacterium]